MDTLKHYGRILKIVLTMLCLMLAACGGGGGGGSSSTSTTSTPAATPPVVTMAFAPATVAAGQATTLTWSSTSATACTASGAWSGSQAINGSIGVTQAIAGNYNYSLTCTGTGGSATAAIAFGVTGVVNNALPVFVDGGPLSTQIINAPYVTVTVCVPGTATCQSIDHVLLDTGSYGLRIISTGAIAGLALPIITGPTGKSVGECAQFVGGYLWGGVHSADVKLAGESAASFPIQIVGDTDPAFSHIPTSCSNTGANIGSLSSLGAKGILGVGLLNQDCGTACTTGVIAGTYYECVSPTCTGSMLPLVKQVANPVSGFVTDNNGVAVVMPPVPGGGVTTLTGVMLFGIDTEVNNPVGSATVYAANSAGNFTVTYKSVTLTSSFIDSGSNGLFFYDPAITLCSSGNGFYCPSSTLALSAVNSAFNGSATGTVNFTIENVNSLTSAIKGLSIGGTVGASLRTRTFDWGMPFFFGRTVFVAIDGIATGHGTGPYWAY